ncbi:helix-turn-helix transcriptional regulator [Oceanobacter mangrovi]|uniref:helix-turn-helix transcriptional regulator n=1 Tax=Oceanobacter mangrovi TaxID=2862510 RepID=UPI001C8E7473|nr:hypothetical protein [Oceanobacter mangrovi]
MRGKPETRISANQLAKRWGVHHQTILNWEKKGLIPKRERMGTMLFWLLSVIEQHEEANNIKPAGGAA